MSQMEGEAEELNKKLQTLQQQHNQAYELLKNLQAKESAEAPTPPRPQEKQLMVTPNEQNLWKFSGKHGHHELSKEDFIKNAKSAITSRGLPSPSRQILYSHKLRAMLKKKWNFTLKVTLKIGTWSLTSFKSLLARSILFPARKSLLTADRGKEIPFEHSPMPWENCKQNKSMSKLSNKDAALPIHLAENIRDPLLRKELKKIIRPLPEVSFLDTRKLFAGPKKTRSPVDCAPDRLHRIEPVLPLSPLS